MTSDDQRLADAEAYGRRLAEETLAEMDRQRERHENIATMANNQHAAQRIARACGGTARDGLRLAYEAGLDPLELPRPRLVKL